MVFEISSNALEAIVWCLYEYVQMPLGQRIVAAALVLLAALAAYYALSSNGRDRARALVAAVATLSLLSITIGATMGHPMPEMELLFVWLPLSGWVAAGLAWLFNRQIYFTAFKPIGFEQKLQAKMDAISLYYGLTSPTVAIFDSAKIEVLSSAGRQPVLLVSLGALEILSQKELEAVLLHEAAHLRHQDSLYKLACTAGLFSLFAPIAAWVKKLSAGEMELAVAAAMPKRKVRHHHSAQRKYLTFRHLENLN